MTLTHPSELKNSVTVHGRAGELLQLRPNASNRILVSGPLTARLFSRVGGGPGSLFEQDWKRRRAREIFFELQQKRGRVLDQTKGNPVYESSLPRGKGFSSSSADILATLLFLDRVYDTNLTRSEIYALAVSIEPTDPLLHTGTIVFDSQKGRVIEELPPLPMTAIYFDSDPLVSVPTPPIHSLPLQSGGAGMIEDFIRSWKEKNYSRIFRLTTRSAILNDAWNPHPGLTRLLDLSRLYPFGVFVAHTGTLLGIVCENQNASMMQELIAEFLKKSDIRKIHCERFE